MFKNHAVRLVRGKIFQNRIAQNAVAERLTSLVSSVEQIGDLGNRNPVQNFH